MKTPTITTPGNEVKLKQIKIALAALLTESLRSGFYGKVALEITIQDGVLQHIRRVVEKTEK
ncbi:MAG: hypothetical protein IT427_13100 [Pirellulales bacterium]|nr:hypothetical protein [Pirellulales bacterium]